MNDLFRSVLKALLTCVITAAVLIFIFGAVAVKSSDSTKNVEIFGKAAFLLSALAGSIAAARSVTENPFVASMIFCGAFLGISLCLALILGNGLASGLWLIYLGAFALCVLGSIIGSYKKPKKTKNFKKFKMQSHN